MPDDELNALLARCEAARRRCEAYGECTLDAYDVSYLPQMTDDTEWRPEHLWWVGFYEYGQGKHRAYGATLPEALTAWLAEYEHQWDEPTDAR